jgi:hypothetical protein
MHTFQNQMSMTSKARRMRPCIIAPKQKGTGSIGQRIQHLWYQVLPSQLPMPTRLSGWHGKDIVQQQHTLLGPKAQVAIGRHASHVGAQLFENIS